jgi:hypothetical protein
MSFLETAHKIDRGQSENVIPHLQQQHQKHISVSISTTIMVNNNMGTWKL